MTQKIRVGDIDVTYKLEGPAGRPIVLMSNSLMSDHSMWDPTVPALLKHYQVLRYDTRGHGQTSVTPGPYSIAQLADDAVGLMDALGVAAAHIMGLSMGGMIAQQIGARYPDRALSLLLCDTASEMPPRSMWEERLAIARKDGIPGLIDSTIKRWFTAPFIERAPQAIGKVRAMILSTPLEGYINCACAVRDMAQTTMLLKIKAPTLIMTGRQDPACTVDQSMVLHRMINTSKMVVIEDAAHLSNIEQPNIFNREICDFLDVVSG
ncbi:MAG: 3-oxoadipate enol-lactonase [Burkholderiaceae bacterium]|nr:3-oxoadipate enol-lactonase [Burkholderiaceae bacterium]